MAIDELGLREQEPLLTPFELESVTEIEPPMYEVLPQPSFEHKVSWRRKALKIAAFMLATIFPFNDTRAADQIKLLHAHSEPVHGDILRVMTANVHGWEGPHGNNLGALMAAMDNEQPDVVCAQEVFVDGGELQQLYNAGYNVLFFAAQQYFAWGRFGNAVISRHPLQLDNVLKLKHDSDHPRTALEFEVGTDRGNIKLVNVHLSPNATSSRLQTDTLVETLHEQFQVGCGDLNQGASALESSQLAEVVPNIWFNMRIAKAAPNSNRGQIDWVFSTCGKPLTEIPMQTDIKSDHYALIEDVDVSLCH